MIQKLYTVREASPLMRRSPSWIYRAAKAGRIHWTDLGGVLFTEEQLTQNIQDAARQPQQADKPQARTHKKDKKDRKTGKAPAAGQLDEALAADIPQADRTVSRLYREGARG